MLLAIKDSWQYPERKEGNLLCEATEKEVVNVARYYHYETVGVDGYGDDIHGNVRKGLDITMAKYVPKRSMMPLVRGTAASLNWFSDGRVAATAKVVIKPERANRPVLTQPGNRELVSVIDGICASRWALPPVIIFEDKMYQVSWYESSETATTQKLLPGIVHLLVVNVQSVITS